MICPNCGAELKPHSFLLHCIYCGYINLNVHDHSHNINSNNLQCDKFYNYLVQNKDYIVESMICDYNHCKGTIVVKCIHEYHPHKLDNICYKGISIRLGAIVTNDSIKIELYVTSSRIVCNDIYVKTDLYSAAYKPTSACQYCSIYEISYDELESLCESTQFEMVIDFNNNVPSLIYNEFLIYCRRFYNTAFNKTKYIYSINQPLISDLL